jgi:putative MATE family efflux protein
MFLALPLSYAYFFVMAALRGAGDSKTPFYFLIISVVLDIALNPLLIFGWGPIPRMGIAGSATATLLAQAISLGALMRHIYVKRNPLVLHRGEFHLLRIDWSIVRTLIVKGLPMGAQMIVLSLSMVLLFKLINRYGEETTAAFAASMQLWNYVQMPALALGGAVSSMAAQNIGAGLWPRVYQIARTSIFFNLLLSGVPVVLLYIFAQPALGLFLPHGSPAVAVAMHLNAIILWSFPLFGISMVLSGLVRAAGAVIPPLLILATAMLVVRLPAAYWAADHWNEDGIWWSFAAAAITAMSLTVLYYKFGNWRSAKMQARSATAGAASARGETPA